MASPQVEDGYTRIANELLSAVYRADLSKRELKIALLVIRATYGFRRKIAPLRIADIATAIGIDRPAASRSVSEMVNHNILIREGTDLGIQKNYLSWKVAFPGNDELLFRQFKTATVAETTRPEEGKSCRNDTARVAETTIEACQNGNSCDGYAATGADSQAPKEIKKEERNIRGQLRGDSSGLTDDHLAQLRDSLDGIPWVAMGIKPENLRARLRGLMESKLKPYGDDVRAAWDDGKPLDVQVSWIAKAMALAKSKCAHNSGVLPYAAGVIVGCLARGQDLLTEDETPPARQSQPSAPAPVPVKRSRHKYADRPWWRDWMDIHFTTERDSLSALLVARNVQSRDGITTVDPARVEAVCEAEGIDAAMAALFAMIRAHVEAQRASAG